MLTQEKPQMFLNRGDLVKYMQRKCELLREQAFNRESETCLRLTAASRVGRQQGVN